MARTGTLEIWEVFTEDGESRGVVLEAVYKDWIPHVMALLPEMGYRDSGLRVHNEHERSGFVNSNEPKRYDLMSGRDTIMGYVVAKVVTEL